jgi:RNA polymerase sigma-70 factor, ECF subfamily
VTDQQFEQVVHDHYASLYWFALGLAREEDEARDLVQQSFYIWSEKSGQIKDPAKVRSWLFTTLHREFLRRRSREQRFPHLDLATVEGELPDPSVISVDQMDASALIQALLQIDQIYRTPLMLFYFEDYSYKKIAEVLELPAGTVMSRLARGKDALRKLLMEDATTQKRAGNGVAECP